MGHEVGQGQEAIHPIDEVGLLPQVRVELVDRVDLLGQDAGLPPGGLHREGPVQVRAPRAYRDRRMARWAADLDRALPVEAAWRAMRRSR